MRTTAPPSPAPSATVTGSRRYGLRVAWMMTASGWSANQFSALLGSYRSGLGMSESAVTGLFALYVLGLVPGLLLGGPLADRYGRRPLALTALAVNLLSTLLLMAGSAAPGWLAPGRFLTGVGAGALLAAGSAWVKELSVPPYETPAHPGTAAKRSGLFVSAGFASGGLAASLIAQWAPYPRVLAYVPHVLLALAAWLAARTAPETRPETGTPAPAAAVEAPGIDRRRFRRAILPLAPWIFAAPTLGFVTLPGLVDGGLHGWETVYAGVATAVVPGAGIAVQPLARHLNARHHVATGATGLAVIALGLLLAVPAVSGARPGLALVAAAVLGAGYGLTLTHALTEAAALAPPARLARVVSLVWTLAYLGMFAPYAVTLLSGTFTVTTQLTAGAVLAVLCGLALTLLNRRRGVRR
ncbi:MFS transporter [Streptomyces sp. NPDC048172]|uniref:MFS transporter n=1 Tax=Streptomyces sp. NPDC048172 TaxID=3365505 RepID=UPI0037249934